MKSNQLVIFFFFSLFSYSSFGQSDISLLISTNELTKFTFEWRKPTSEKVNFKIGITAGSENGNFLGGPAQIRVVNDTIEQTFRSNNSSRYGLKLGLERQIKSSVFYYGVDLFSGYELRESQYYQTFTPADAEGMDFIVNTASNPEGTGGRKSHFISVGGLVSFGMNLTITERFLFNASFGMGYNVNSYLNTSDVVDPLQIYTWTPGTNTTLFTTANVGIRYKLFKAK